MRESIKKISKSALITLLVIFLLPAGAFLFIQNNKVQTWLVQKIAHSLSERLKTNITLSHVNIGFFNRINIDSLLILDQNKDTLIFSPRVSCSVNAVSRATRHITIGNITLNQGRVKLISDTAKVINVQFLLDAMKAGPDTTKGRWHFDFNSIAISKGLFTYHFDIPLNAADGAIDYSNIVVSNLNLSIDDLNLPKDSVCFHISKLNGKEKSGLIIKNFTADFALDSVFMHWRNIRIKTAQSSLSARQFLMDYGNIRDISAGNFGKKVKLELSLLPSTLALPDLAYFVPLLQGIPHTVQISGIFTGIYSDLKARNIKIRYNDQSGFFGNIDFIGLPDYKHTYLYANIKEFTTSASDVESLRIPALKNGIVLPVAAGRFGQIHYSGKFTGFFDDFVAYGRMESPLGIMNADLVITHDTMRNFTFRGRLSASGFDLGKLIPTKNDRFGLVNFNTEVDGIKEGKLLHGNVQGGISSVEFNHYFYRNTEIKGTFTRDTYDGSISVNDPNFKMDFLGRLDFSKEKPEYDFTANIPHADLYKLHITQDDSVMNLSCILTANFVGNNINTFDGDIKLLNAKVEKADKMIYLYNLSLSALNGKDSGRLSLRSDFFDARVDGKYDFKSIGKSFHRVIRTFLPSLADIPDDQKTTDDNHFKYQLKVKDVHDLLGFFLPSVTVSNNATMSGSYNPSAGEMLVNGYCDTLTYNQFKFNGFSINASAGSQGLEFTSGSQRLSFKNQINFDNFTATGLARNDSVFTSVRAINWDTILNKGSIYAQGFLHRLPENETPILDFFIQPSQVTVKNITWNIDPCHITVDTSGLGIHSFNLYSGDQYLKVDGEVRSKETALLKIELKKLKAQNLNIFTMDKGFSFTGDIVGSASLSDFFRAPVFQGNFDIDSLTINGEMLGKTNLGMAWKSELQRIDIKVASWRQNLQTVNASGYYVPSSHAINVDVDMNKLRVNILRPYFAKIFSNINGLATGHLRIGGATTALLLNGEIDCQKISFLVNYLQTRYNFSDVITVNDNRFNFNNITVYDEMGNIGTLNGWAYGNYLKNWSLNFSLDAHNVLCLNTQAKDNDLYYGRAFGTGTASITGPIENLKLNIKGTSEKNTVLYIPLTSGEVVTESGFISFKSHEDGGHKTVVPAASPVSLSGMQMNFEFNITPDAEAQLIFDPKMGDIIKGRGNGNIKMDISTLGKFRMFGDFVIDEGEYLFTLQNVINKRFKVDRGGTVSWNGDPLDANLNIRAVYPVKTSLYDLLIQEANDEYKKRIPVECEIYLTDKLMKPSIRYDINLPTAEDELKSKVRNAINTQEELSKQFLSLLVLNSFMPDPNRNQVAESTNTYGATGVGVTTSELLSNQLSNWLSQISNDFDIGVNYRPGDQITSQQVEVALSTQLLNDRVSINGNLDVRGNQTTPTASGTSASNIVGDFVVDIKLNESGKLQMKAFNRTNDQILYDISPYTQGVGISYNEEFNNFGGLLKRYWGKLFKKEEEPIPLPVKDQKKP